MTKNLLPLLLSFVMLVCCATTGYSSDNYSQKRDEPAEALTFFFEDFDNVATPDLPEGWTAIHQGTAGSVQTITTTVPFSSPNHVRLANAGDLNATLVLVGPKIKNFQTNWLRFMAKLSATSHSGHFIVGYMPERQNLDLFVAADTLFVQGNQYSQYSFSFQDILTDSDEYHVAFRFIPENTFRNLLLDDIMWEPAPTQQVMVVTPDTFDFGRQVNGKTSEAQQFEIYNDGVLPITVSPSDIFISGDDTSDFILENIDQQVTLEMMESVTFNVSFFPVQLGSKQATVNVRGSQIPLSGISEDPLITVFPYNEDFDSEIIPDLPFGWNSIVENSTYESSLVATTTSIGPNSAPNHLRMFSDDNTTAFVAAITPPIQNLSTKRVRFWAKCNINSTKPSLIVGTMSDPDDQSTFNEFLVIDGETEITNGYQQYVVEMNETIGENQYLVFRQGPTPSNARSLYIDDLVIDEIPTAPILVTQPGEINFEPIQINIISDPVEVLLINDGAGILEISPEDISISGPDSERFLLNNLESTVNLAQYESAVITVTFAPAQAVENNAVLNVLNKSIPLSGEPFDATITEFPHLESFQDVSTPHLPHGWFKIVDNPTLTAAAVETSTLSTPFSAPNHVRLNSNDNQDAVVMLISPPVENLSAMRVRFWAKCNVLTNIPDLIVGTMSDPTNELTFLPLDTISADQLSNAYNEQFTVNFNGVAGDHKFFAFKHGATPQYNRFLYLDDIQVEEIPDEPIIEVTPSVFDFGMVQTGEQSYAISFEILNDGGGTLVLNEQDIILQGEYTGEYTLTNISETANLLPGETASVEVTFSPQTVGVKPAVLAIGSFNVEINGEGIDATISAFPWNEDFTDLPGSEIPFGWKRSRENWGANNTSNAGGTSPEMRFHFTPQFSGIAYLQSPKINTTGHEELQLSFRHQVNNFSSPGPYTLQVYVVANDNEYLLQQWVDPSDVDAELLTYVLNDQDHGIGSDRIFIKWVFDGQTSGINQWYIDDISLGEVPPSYTVEFSIEDQSGAPIQDATVTFGDITNSPGDYIFNDILAGSYDYSITADHFETITGENFEVTADTDIQAQMTALTYTVTFGVTDQDDIEIPDAVITFGDITNEAGNYVFENVLAGDYNYLVQADGYHEVAGSDFSVTGNAATQVILTPVLYDVVFQVNGQDNSPITNAVITFNGQTNSAGDYSFTGVLAGTYSYSVTADGYIPATADNVVVDDDTTVEVTMENETFTVNFEVTDHDGVEIANAVITMGEITNPAGNYTFNGIIAGSYDYIIAAPGYNTVNESGLNVSQDVTVEVSMVQTVYSVTFIVEDSEGAAILDAQITFDGNQNQAGNYIFEGITEGIYDYMIVADGYETVEYQNLEVAADTTITVEMVSVVPEYRITFEITCTDGNTIEDAVITLDDHSYEAGMYVFDVQPGTYTYLVTMDGYEDSEGQVSVTDADVVEEVSMQAIDTSIPDIVNAAINIFPNPAKELLNIHSESIINEVSIFDISGRIVYNSQVHDYKMEINVSDFNTGMYFINMVTSDGVTTRRFSVLK